MSRGGGTPLTAADSAWLRMEHPTNLMTITGLMTFAERVDHDRLRRRIDERVAFHPRFRSRVVERGGLKRPVWREHPEFALDDHLVRSSLPEPADKRALEEFVAARMSTPLDPARPLWKFHHVDNFEGRSALVMRVHHCMGDGMSLMRLTIGAMDEPPTEAEPAHVGHAGRAGRGRFAAALRKTAEGVVIAARLLAMRGDPPTAFKGPLGIDKRVAWSERLPLDEIKRISRGLGGTLNDVLLSAMAGALGAYLRARGEATDGLDLRAVVPVNLRPPSDLTTLENRFGLVFLELPVGELDPLARLATVGARMRRLKRSPEAVVLFLVAQAVGRTTARVQSAVVNLLGKNATAVMTNVPGPRTPLRLCGAEVDDFMFWVPQSGRLGLGISILSYGGGVRVGLASDAGLVADPETLVAAFHDALGELSRALAG